VTGLFSEPAPFEGSHTITFSYVPPAYWYKPYPRTQPNIGAGIDSLVLTGTVKAGAQAFASLALQGRALIMDPAPAIRAPWSPC